MCAFGRTSLDVVAHLPPNLGSHSCGSKYFHKSLILTCGLGGLGQVRKLPVGPEAHVAHGPVARAVGVRVAGLDVRLALVVRVTIGHHHAVVHVACRRTIETS